MATPGARLDSVSPLTPRQFKVAAPAPEDEGAPTFADRLRQVLGRNAFFFLLTFALLMMFSPYLIMAFLDLDERQLVRNLGNNPEAMRMLIFIIVCKMVGLGTIFTCLPLVKEWFMEDMGGPHPKSAKRTRSPSLTHRQRQLLTHGWVSRGTVESMRWPKVKVSYLDPAGRRHARWISAHGHISDRPAEGEEIFLLLDPQRPEDATAPRLLDVTFEPQREVHDVRPESFSERRTAAPIPSDTGAFRVGLRSTLSPIPRGRISSLGSRLRGRSVLSCEVGALCLDGPTHTLTQRMLDGSEPRFLRLDRRFGVDASVWLKTAQTAEVTLTLKGQDHSGQALRLRAVLPQHRISAELSLKQSNAPFVDSDDFEALWELLSFHAASNGDDLSGLVRLGEDVPAADFAQVLR